MKNFSHDVEKMFSDSWNGGIITSPDWDGIVSAAIICAHFEKTHLIGFYVPNDDNDTSRVYLSDQINDDNILDELENAVWVDLDIFDRRFSSIGQHLISIFSGEHNPVIKGSHRFSRNPNSINPHDYRLVGWDHVLTFPRCHQLRVRRGNTHRSRCDKKALDHQFCGIHGGLTKSAFVRGFLSKYPFATAHFLLDGLGVPESFVRNSLSFPIVSHCDSAILWSIKYRENALSWWDYFSENSLHCGFISSNNPNWLDVPNHVRDYGNFLLQLLDSGLIDLGARNEQPSSVVEILQKFWKGTRYQSICSDLYQNGDQSDLCERFTSLTGMVLRGEGECRVVMEGIAHKLSINDDTPLREIPWENEFSGWLNNHQVFSLAFTLGNTINYTTGMELNFQLD